MSRGGRYVGAQRPGGGAGRRSSGKCRRHVLELENATLPGAFPVGRRRGVHRVLRLPRCDDIPVAGVAVFAGGVAVLAGTALVLPNLDPMTTKIDHAVVPAYVGFAIMGLGVILCALTGVRQWRRQAPTVVGDAGTRSTANSSVLTVVARGRPL